MSFIHIVYFILTLFLLGSCDTKSSTTNEVDKKSITKPNIILIVADDMGYSDFQPFGGEIKTPSLQALADSGLILADFYTAPTCSPARAMILSGNDNHVAGVGNMAEVIPFTSNLEGKPGYEGYLNDQVVPFPILLQNNGYHTYACGKWHLGSKEGQTPYYKGFEETFVLLSGGGSHWDDLKKHYERANIQYSSNGKSVKPPKDFYSTLGYTDQMMKYINKNKEDGKPFFGYLAFTAPHDPLHVPDDWVDRYKGYYDMGYDELRENRFKKLQEKGIIAQDIQLVDGLNSIAKWSDLSVEEQILEAKKMEIYAAMIEYFDMQIGRLIHFLKENDLYENTLIMFISDNGANPKYLREYPGSSQEWVDKHFDNSYENIGRKGSGVATGPGWAQASMSPFKFFKTYTAEGGIKAPFIVSGYGVGMKGEINTQALTSAMDIAPTILKLAGVEYPKLYKGQMVKPMQGKSMLPLFEGKSEKIRTTDDILGWELFGHKAIRKGDWKILWVESANSVSKWELYNLKNDPSESNDLSKVYPEKLEELIKGWERYQKDNGVIIPKFKEKNIMLSD
ncbi:arylsulfatase [Sediminitomix flava]|uniref:Arylsulfatase n=1 Tax=Sediminitomix flava TaxID=379075 RepID=A0A315ZAV5_SEDFL|nr:arylsulfatase [Sediminitomix flava]PWJ42681.1 arylsulfatase [Sediminitomix flava]